MKKTFFLLGILVALSHQVTYLSAQEILPEKLGVNTVYAELGGVAGLYSLNYERVLYTPRRAFNFGVGGGVSYRGPLYPYESDFFALIARGALLIHYSKVSSAEIGVNPVVIMSSQVYLHPGGP